MRVGLADEQEVVVVEKRAPTEGLMGVEIVAQEGEEARVIAGGVVLQPAFGGGQFAILFGVAILRGDELGPQGDDLRLAGSHEHRRHRTVIVSDLAALMFEVGTARAVDLLRGMIPGAVQGDERRVVDTAQSLQNPRCAQGVVDPIIHRIEGLGRDGVEHLANLIVAGDRLEVEETLGVVMTPRLLHRLLIRQEGGRLSEEDREAAQTKVGHRIGDVLAPAPVGQSGEHLAQVADQIVEARAAQAPSLRRKSALNSWR